MADQIILPEGWTYFAHRTNTARWQEDPFSMDEIVIKNLMSVVTERDVYQELRDYGPTHFQSYSSGTGKPFEIRTLICTPLAVRSMSDDNPMKSIMYNEFYFDKNNFGGCRGLRHHSIPKGEELVVLGIGDYDEVFDHDSNIIWTIPKRFIDFYKKELLKGTNRVIDIKKAPSQGQIEGLMHK